MINPTGLALTVDLTPFSDLNLRHACATVHTAAGVMLDKGLDVGNVLLAIAAGLDEARRARAAAWDAITRGADDEEAGALLEEAGDILGNWTPDL
jgi:hypothetical protein